MQHKRTERKITLDSRQISIRFFRPTTFDRCIIVANGAGAPMESTFIRFFCESLADRGFLSVSFNFAYQEEKRKVPDRGPLLENQYLGVLAESMSESGLTAGRFVIGGKSMGGRIATQIADRAKPGGYVLLGYPQLQTCLQ